jgi:hypothetical protein
VTRWAGRCGVRSDLTGEGMARIAVEANGIGSRMIFTLPALRR